MLRIRRCFFLALAFSLVFFLLSGCGQINENDMSQPMSEITPNSSASVSIEQSTLSTEAIPQILPPAPGTFREPVDNTNREMPHSKGEIIKGGWSDFGTNIVVEYSFFPETNEERLMIMTVPEGKEAYSASCLISFYTPDFRGFSGLIESLRSNSFQAAFDCDRLIWIDEAMSITSGAFLSSVNEAEYPKDEIIKSIDYTVQDLNHIEEYIIHMVDEKKAETEGLIPYMLPLGNGYCVSIKDASNDVLSDAMKRSVQIFDSVYQRYH